MSELRTITDLLDSNYRADLRAQVIEAPWILADNLGDPKELLKVEEWRNAKLAVDREIEELTLGIAECQDGVLVKTISTDMHLTSIVARKLASSNQDAEAVIVCNLAREQAPFYVRRANSTIDLTPIIDIGRRLGYSAGGKPEVVGMIVPRRDLDTLTQKIIAFLEESR